MSIGGPGICPSCDCGDFGLQKTQRQGHELVAAHERLAALERENARLREALDPFAAWGDVFEQDHDGKKIQLGPKQHGWFITVGQFRRARAAIAKTEAADGQA